ncbi:MAG: hypothetical protein JWO08_2982, partial [Verrucomicrobiaceae bacterium]|nr:hypothetical protein [Verrucomicrobiaceae bacterium]
MQSLDWCLVAAFCLFPGLFMTHRGGCEWLEEQKLDKQGVLADARIVGRFTTGKNPDGTAHWATVNFVPEGHERLTTSMHVSDTYAADHENPATSHVTVRYLPDHPETAVIEGERTFPYQAVVGPVLVVAGLLCGGMGV